jgi:fibro-slime domain-containing protein
MGFALGGCGGDDEDDGAFGGSGGSGAGSGATGNGAGAFTGGGITIGNGGSSGNGTGQNSGASCDGKLTGRIRDFRASFPDMEPAHSGKCDICDDRNVVTTTIGSDLKPVYAGPASGTATTTGPENFDKWFRDVEGVNSGVDLPLQFTDPDQDGVFTYDNQMFFPIDGQLFGNESNNHNFHFTFELHTEFEYEGGETFTFVGDDDVWTYIDGKRVVDLGGIHGAQTAAVQLDTLGLQQGQKYRLDFFFAERHVTESHFRIDTTIQFIDCGFIIR